MELRMIPLLILLLLVAACHSASDKNNPLLPSDVAADIVFEPTGNATLDSLLLLAFTAKQDTVLARLYNEIGDMYKDNDFEKAKVYYQKLKDLSEQLDWNQGLYLFSKGFSLILNREGLTDSALVINQQALELARREKNEHWIANIGTSIGTSYFVRDWNETALTYYMEALSVFERDNETEKLESIYPVICQIYDNMGAQEKAIEYGEKALTLNPKALIALVSLGKAYSSDERTIEKSNHYFEEALQICIQQNNLYMMGSVYYQMGTNAIKLFELDKAEYYAQRALEIHFEIGNMPNYCDVLLLLGKLELFKGRYAQSEIYVREALQIATEYELLEEEKYAYLILGELAIAQGDYREYVQHWNEENLVDMVIASETVLQASQEMEAKYETEKKELKITALEEEKHFMLWLSISCGAALFLSLALCFFLWRWTVQKKRLAEQQIKQLIQEKQLVATQSVLDGETRERTRLARDLHDGLGSLLTGAKLQLLEMKQGVKLEYADIERFDKALGLLDDSVNEMRRVAHHLMPDSLSRFGLKPAVTDFCANLATVQFTYYGDESRLDPNMEVMIYRSIHELVNNALKHATASRIIVQIIQEPDRIAYTVQDDGSGFDPSVVTEGMGLQNIRTRVEAYNGMIDINSNAGEGTEINVELGIN